MRNSWTDEEIEFVKENYKNMSDAEISEALLNRHTIAAISTKRKKLGYTRSNRKYTFDDVVYEFSKTNYELISISEDYIDSAANTLKYICPIHKDEGIQYISLSHLQSGRGCYYCGRDRTETAHRLDDNINDKECYEIAQSKKFIYKGFRRMDGLIYIDFICPNHSVIGIQSMRKGNMARDNIIGCKYCVDTKKFKFSKGERAIENVLNELGVIYVRQFIFDDCKDFRTLPFDFYLPKLNSIIEYDGEHHYMPVNFNGISEEAAEFNYERTVRHDKIKNEYCEMNGISLLRIPYSEFKNIDKLVKDFINKF